MTVTAPQLPCMAETEVRNVAVSFVGKLDAGELLTGTPTVTEVDEDGAPVGPNLSFSNIAVNTAELTINRETVAIGEAVQFRVTAGVGLSGSRYYMRVEATTTASPAQTLQVVLPLDVVLT